jgi:hypothetical protein
MTRRGRARSAGMTTRARTAPATAPTWSSSATAVAWPSKSNSAQKSAERLKAIIGLHARWRAARATGGVIYICADQDGCDRIRTIAERTGLLAMRGGGLRVELLDTIRAQALAACEQTRASRAGERPGVRTGAGQAIAHGS